MLLPPPRPANVPQPQRQPGRPAAYGRAQPPPMGAGAAPPPPRSSARRARAGRPHPHRSLVDVLTLLCCVLRHARVQMGRRLTGFGFRHPLEATRLRQIPCCAVVVGQESNDWSFKGDVDLAKATVLNRLCNIVNIMKTFHIS